MIQAKGLILKNLPFQDLQRIGTLLFKEYPVTDVYLSENDPVIKEWVDCNEEDTIDRYYYYSINRHLLLNFIEGSLSHRDLLLNNRDGYVILTEESKTKTLNQKVISINDLPSQYLPSQDTYVKKSEIVDLKIITEKLELNKVTKLDLSSLYHKNISTKYDAETYNLHLKTGRGVKFGTIDTELLGRTAIEFDKFYKELSYDIALGKNRGQVSLSTKKHAELIEFSKTEVYHSVASSYSLFIRPKNYTSDLFDDDPFSVAVAKRIFKLLEESQSEDIINETYKTYSDYVISSYVEFMDQIVKNDLKIDFAWYRPADTSYLRNKLSLISANSAINNITKISSTENEDFDVKGKFSALNCNTGHYSFKSINDEEYSGYFDKLIRDSMVTLNFTDLYKITIDRTSVKKAGNSVPKIKDDIVSYTILEE